MDSSLLRPADLRSPLSSGWGGRRLHAIPVAAGLLLICGCSLMPWRKDPAPTPSLRTSDKQASVPGETAPPRSHGSGIDSRERTGAVADTTAPASKTAATPVSEPAAPNITIQLTDEERARLIDETEKDVALITACLRRLDREHLDEGQRRSLTDVEDLQKAVMKARDESDVQAASRLARKARLLAEDLAAQ